MFLHKMLYKKKRAICKFTFSPAVDKIQGNHDKQLETSVDDTHKQ